MPSTPPSPPPPPPAASSEASAPVRVYPETPMRPVVNEYHGVKVTDLYQWLEKSNDPEVIRWTEDQSRVSSSMLEALPETQSLRQRFEALLKGRSRDFVALMRRGGSLFALQLDPSKQQPVLVVLSSPDAPDSAKVLVDPNKMDEKGGVTIDFYVASHDGKKVAVSLSKGGSEAGDVHFYDVEKGTEIGEVIPLVNSGTAGGSLAWSADDKGVYYTRHPRPGERPPEDMGFYQQIYFHALGTATDKDHYEIGKDFPRIAETDLSTSEDGKILLAQMGNGDGGEYAHYILGPSKKWTKFAAYDDKIVGARIGADGKLYVLSRKGAPRGKILRLDPKKADLEKAEVLVPEGDGTIESFAVTKDRMYVAELAGGPSRLRVFDLKRKGVSEVPIPAISSVSQIVRMDGDEILIRLQSYIEPPAWYRFSGSGEVKKTKLFTTSPADFADAEVTRETCHSKDGTEVPLNIVRKKGIKLDGSNPALLTGYGGFDVSLKPHFRPEGRVWLDYGGVFAVANLRGGGEFGEKWHEDGRLEKKQNVFDDFAACAEHLVAAGYTTHSKLGIMGGSNGGLLMGAMITQHPEMFRAVVSSVGIYDMLRMELWPNGAFNVTEYGSVKDPTFFKAMYSYSPYHHVEDKKAYPAVLFTTGLNDPRVDPSQSRKMAARLQAASSSSAPILLLAKSNAGHGVGGSLSQAIERLTYNYAFLMHQIGAAK